MRKVLIAFFILSCLAFSVSAAEMNDNDFVNVLDYTTFDTDGNNVISISSGDNTFNVPLPFSGYTRYVDLLILTNLSNFSVSAAVNDTSLSTLTVESISTNYFRVYGNIPFRRGDSMKFVFNSSSSGTIEVLQFRYASARSNTFDIEAYCTINTGDYSSTIHYVPTDDINHRQWTNDTELINAFYQLYLWVEDWRKYDYIDIQLFLDVASIQSISGMFGNDNIDLDISYVSGEQWDSNYYYVTIGIDCTQFVRTTDDDPQVLIFGNVKFNEANSVNFVNCSGKVFRSEPDSITFWFSSLNATIDSNFANLRSWIQAQTTAIVNAINGDQTSGDQFKEDVEQRDEELENMAAIMESVPKPDVDDLDFDIAVDYSTLTPLTFTINSVLNNNYIGQIFLMAFILALAAYILYGKRD